MLPTPGTRTRPPQSGFVQVLGLYLKRPRAEICGLSALYGRFRYSDLKEAVFWAMDFVCAWAGCEDCQDGCCSQYAGVAVRGSTEKRRGECLGKSGWKSDFEFLRQARQRGSVGVGARGRCEAGDVGSCCAAAGMRRRSEKQLGRGEPLDDKHDSATEGTVPGGTCGQRARRSEARWWLIGLLENAEAKWK